MEVKLQQKRQLIKIQYRARRLEMMVELSLAREQQIMDCGENMLNVQMVVVLPISSTKMLVSQAYTTVIS